MRASFNRTGAIFDDEGKVPVSPPALSMRKGAEDPTLSRARSCRCREDLRLRVRSGARRAGAAHPSNEAPLAVEAQRASTIARACVDVHLLGLRPETSSDSQRGGAGTLPVKTATAHGGGTPGSPAKKEWHAAPPASCAFHARRVCPEYVQRISNECCDNLQTRSGSGLSGDLCSPPCRTTSRTA
jgi:hypothetical protein